uniref:Uncharacterized protein n=1 Tax=Parascaris equorum TaxID=6256 RepID=A0A914RJE6_PAREQ
MNIVNSFEEFEAKPSLFDLLEMNTIDDKAALEEVLLASVPRVICKFEHIIESLQDLESHDEVKLRATLFS